MTAMWVEEPVVEKAMVVPSASRMDCSGDSDFTYQNSSREPVELAPMMRNGAPWGGAETLSVPALKPTSTAPEMTACRVSPPPAV